MSEFLYKGKRIFYQEKGMGPLLVMLHGNAASGKMFEGICELYPNYHIVILDFLGNGRSQRVAQFCEDYWYDQGMQVLTLLKQFPNEKAILYGTSGGAIAALHAALSAPSQIRCVIADSFEGDQPIPALEHGFYEQRMASLQDPEAILFYQYMQGEDYETIVHMDTAMMMHFYEANLPYFHQSLSSIQVPVLLMGSEQDDLIPNIKDAYNQLAQTSSMYQIQMVKEGKHPACLSNPYLCADIVLRYLNDIQ